MDLQVFVERRPPEYLTRSVGDLVDCLAKALSARVKTKAAPKADRDGGIWVGRTAAVAPFADSLLELNHDGYMIWGDGSKLVISGKTVDGTVNGIYSFLHRFLGVRWFAPGEDFEFVPRLERLRLPVIEEVFNPSFRFRMYSGIDPEWSRRNMMDRSRPELPFSAFGHNLTNIFPPDEFASEHPEIYALIDGQRLTDQTSHRGQPCFSNPLTVEVAVGKIRKHFEDNPNSTTYSVSVNDNIDFCRCAECESFGVGLFRGRRIYSNVYFDWVKRVASMVQESHPDKYLAALAYWGVVLPPAQIEKLPGNVVIFLTQDTSQHHDPAYMDADRQILGQWLGKCSNLVKYDYYGLGWLTPRYFPSLATQDLSFLAKSGVTGFYCEAYPFWPNIAPQLYAAAQMAWNADREPPELFDEFFAFFAPVSDEIAAFYRVLEQSWIGKRPGRWFEGLGNLPDELRVMSLQDANRARQHLQQAYEGSSGNCRRRIQFILDGFEFSYQLIRGYHTALELRSFPVSEESDLEAALPLLSEVQECVERTYQLHTDKIVPDARYSEVYFKDRRFERKYRTWRGIVTASCIEWLEAAHNYFARPVMWSDLRSRLPAGLSTHADIIEKLESSANLLPGVGAEDAEKSVTPTKTFVIGRWRIVGEGSCEMDRSMGHKTNASLRFEGKGRSRLTMCIPVKGSKPYLVGAWAYMLPAERARAPTLDVTFMEKPSEEPGEFATSDILECCGKWRRLFALVHAPQKAKLMGIHFVLDGEQDMIWLDDISVIGLAGGR